MRLRLLDLETTGTLTMILSIGIHYNVFHWIEDSFYWGLLCWDTTYSEQTLCDDLFYNLLAAEMTFLLTSSLAPFLARNGTSSSMILPLRSGSLTYPLNLPIYLYGL